MGIKALYIQNIEVIVTTTMFSVLYSQMFMSPKNLDLLAQTIADLAHVIDIRELKVYLS
jgi:hypothetical protein